MIISFGTTLTLIIIGVCQKKILSIWKYILFFFLIFFMDYALGTEYVEKKLNLQEEIPIKWEIHQDFHKDEPIHEKPAYPQNEVNYRMFEI